MLDMVWRVICFNAVLRGPWSVPRKAPDDKIKFVCPKSGSACYVEHVHAIRISRYLFGSGLLLTLLFGFLKIAESIPLWFLRYRSNVYTPLRCVHNMVQTFPLFEKWSDFHCCVVLYKGYLPMATMSDSFIALCWRINLFENQPAVTVHISDLTGFNETLIMAQNISEMQITWK